MLQDYHLYLTAGYIRNKLDNIFLNQFIHVPWPESDYLSILPGYIVDSIMESLLANDIVGFHIPRYVQNFLKSCELYADNVDYENNIIYRDDHHTMVRSYPISIDVSGIQELGISGKVTKYEDLIKKLRVKIF